MVQEALFDADGRIFFDRAKPQKWGDTSISMDTGYSTPKIREIKNEELARIAQIAPWNREIMITQHRNIYAGLCLLVGDHLDSENVSGYSNYHYKLIPDELPVADEHVSEIWGIDQGARYHFFEKRLITGLKGDDSPMDNWPLSVTSVSLAFLFAFVWNCGLAHCRYSSICTLISGESCHSTRVSQIIKKQCKQMQNHDKLVLWCHHKKCYCLFNLKFYFCSDWVFECTIFRLLGPTSKHFLHGITRFKDGEPQIISDNLNDLWDAFTTGIDKNDFHVNLQERMDNKWSGYCLTTNEIIQYLSANKFVPAMEKANLECKSDDIEQRRQIANNASVPMLYDTCDWYYSLLTELFHAFDTYNAHLLRYIVYTCHASFNWSKTETQTVVDEIG